MAIRFLDTSRVNVWTNHALRQETHLVSEFDTVELVSRFEQFRPEGGGDELGMACQLDDHV